MAEFPRAWMRRRKPAVGAGFRARIRPHLRAFGPRNSPQFRAFPLDNLSKNPVNLSNFTGIYRIIWNIKIKLLFLNQLQIHKNKCNQNASGFVTTPAHPGESLSAGRVAG